ncbi:MAG: hypothetical protein F6K19_01525 [Cyanothece sp. SIO1E1]|nr:hypothetical protein [Cyanothece sp. SIO1E1]
MKFTQSQLDTLEDWADIYKEELNDPDTSGHIMEIINDIKAGNEIDELDEQYLIHHLQKIKF